MRIVIASNKEMNTPLRENQKLGGNRKILLLLLFRRNPTNTRTH